MRVVTFFFAFIFIFSLSCKKDTSPLFGDENLTIISENKIDINGDGIFDLESSYKFLTNGQNSSKIVQIIPLYETRLLYHFPIGHQIFYTGDTVKSTVNFSNSWNSFGADIASCDPYQLNNWRGLWAGKTGYLPIKIIINSEYHCAWVHMTVDTIKAKIEFFGANFNRTPNQDFVISN